jgi:soluble lytic murein transglycosylase-like protein
MAQRLDFSGRARRRERRTRLSLAAWGISTVATLVGVPTGTEALGQLATEPDDTPAQEASTSTLVLLQDQSGHAFQDQRNEVESSTLVLIQERRERARRQRLQAERRRERRAERRRERRAERRRERRAERRRERREERQEEALAAQEPQTVSEIIAAAGAEYGVDADYLMSVAWCESDLDPGAVSPAGYYGLFQFDQQTWAAYGYGSIYDPVAQSRTAARMLAAGMSDRWPNCA